MSANAVALDLVVRDKKGKPVLDLRPDQIAVTDNNTPVALDNLHLVNGQQGGDHLVSLIFDRPVPDRPVPTSGTKHPIDPYAKPAQDTAAMILKMVPGGSFSFAVLSVQGRLHLEQGFTSDRRLIAQAVNAAMVPLTTASGSSVSAKELQLIQLAKTGHTPSETAAGTSDRQLAQVLYTALDRSGRIETDEHIRPSLASLLAMVQAQQQLKQRKAILYFTSENQTQFDSHDKETVRSIVGAANRAGVSIYIFDLNALDSTGRKMAEAGDQIMGLNVLMNSSSGPGLIAATTTATANLTFAEGIGAGQEGDKGEFQRLAEATGGGYISTADGIRQPVKQMVEDMTTYYHASYVPPVHEYDGSFRPIAVKPLRAGLKVRAQTGYLALPAGFAAGTEAQPFEAPLLKTLAQTQLPADVPFHASILRMGNLPEGSAITLAIEVPLSGVEVRQDSSTNLYSAHVSIVGQIRDRSGEVIEHFSEDVPRRGALKDVEAGSLSAITMERHFVASPGDYVLEAAVLDINSGKSGAERVAFQVQESASMPYLSDLVLVRKMELSRPGDDLTEPLRYGDKRITPNLSGELPHGSHDISLFVIAHSDPGKTEAAELTFQLFKDGKPLGGSFAANHQTNNSEFASYASFSIQPAENGAYQVKALLRQGGKTAESETSFTLTGIPPAHAVADALIDPTSLAVPPQARELPIVSPKNPIQRPEPDELESFLADAAQYATGYVAALPNFMCQKVTIRLEDPHGAGAWKQQDKIVEMLTNVNHREDRKLLQIDKVGSRTHEAAADTYLGLVSFGEFGQALALIFKTSSKADFEWKETAVLGDLTVQVFDYRVSKKNSTFNLRSSGEDVTAVGFHGQVFIDTATRAVRRLTMTADDAPANFPLRATSINVDYGYIQLNDHDYLMPITAEVNTWRRNHGYLNQIEFRNFHRFGSKVRILDTPPDVQAKPPGARGPQLIDQRGNAAGSKIGR